MTFKLAVRSVADTAYATAYARACESEREDAQVVDPYARQLAGARGQVALEHIPGKEFTAAGCIVRTSLMDRQLLECFASHGIRRVLNLGAGLDTRPYRLPLPTDTDWIEVDSDEILAYKSRMLQDHRPKCRLRRIPADLGSGESRQRLLNTARSGSDPTLVITEGLLTYLGQDSVSSLADELIDCRSVSLWLTDLISSEALMLMRMLLLKPTPAGANVSLEFAPEQGPNFFRQFGWQPISYHSCFAAGRQMKRWLVSEDFVARLTTEQQSVMQNLLGVLCLERDTDAIAYARATTHCGRRSAAAEQGDFSDHEAAGA